MDFQVQIKQLKKCVFMQDVVVQKIVNEKNHMSWLSKRIDSDLMDVEENIYQIELQMHRQISDAKQLKRLLELIKRTYEITETEII